MEKQDHRWFFSGGGTVFHVLFCWKKQTDRHFIVSVINFRIQCPVKDSHRIHLLKICQLSGSLHFDPAIGKSMEHCPHGTWHSSFSPGRNARNYDWAASSVFFSCIDIFCFCFISSRNADLFHAGTPVGNPLQDLMICTDDHFRSLIAPDIISVFFLFYTWLSQSQ